MYGNNPLIISFVPFKMLCHFSSFSLCITSITLFSLLFSVHGRWHNHAKKHKHSHGHLHHLIPISQPPSPSPSLEPACPPDIDDGGSSSFNNSTGIFDVRRFGAVGDGTADDTTAFKTAWDSACQSDNDNNPVVILVPYGFSFLIQSTIFTGPCKNGVVFQVDGTLMAPDGPEAWPKSYSAHQWLVFYRVYNMSLLGNGIVDGRGQKWWDLPCKPHKVRARAREFLNLLFIPRTFIYYLPHTLQENLCFSMQHYWSREAISLDPKGIVERGHFSQYIKMT